MTNSIDLGAGSETTKKIDLQGLKKTLEIF